MAFSVSIADTGYRIDATASGIARRNFFEDAAREAQDLLDSPHCPTGLSPCNIGGDEHGGYEVGRVGIDDMTWELIILQCIDTSTELGELGLVKR